MSELIPVETIYRKIYLIRGEKVMLDTDLAILYGVKSKALNQAVKRNAKRFPESFMFRLTDAEYNDLRSQIVTSSWGGRRYAPYVFTEHGVAMLSSVLNSDKAIAINIQIIQAFIQLRRMLAAHDDLRRKIEALEKKYDRKFTMVFDVLDHLMAVKCRPTRKIGFNSQEK